MKIILFVHQSADLYGSDKILLSLLEGLNKQKFKPVVLLPCTGPLLTALRERDISTLVVPLMTVGRSTLSILGMARAPLELFRSLKAMNLALAGMEIDLVHSNTLAVISGALWARMKRLPHVWHVHEIIQHPGSARVLFPFLLRIFAHKVICNSFATRKILLNSQPSLLNRSVVIWNGIERPHPVNKNAVASLRQRLGMNDETILVVLAGRINRWKGQGVFVEAAKILQQKGEKNIHYLIVGSPPHGQEWFREDLEKLIAASPTRETITLMDFDNDIWTIWDACDIAVVASTEPEPFGLVAVEAMASERPVIASDCGGLKEIVLQNETGLLVPPGNAEALADAIRALSRNPKLRERMGTRGKAVQEEKFSVSSYVKEVVKLYDTLMES